MNDRVVVSALAYAAIFSGFTEGFGVCPSCTNTCSSKFNHGRVRKIFRNDEPHLRFLDATLQDAVDGSVDPAEKFHVDMKRVLESRKHAFDESSKNTTLSALSPMDRRKRPAVLSKDVDGANRVTSMLRHMVNIGVANEETYQIVLEALCRRGRLRWLDSDSSVVCAADVVEELMEELWERKSLVSTYTCNLALQAYASCSTPRGDRRYAEKAQNLLYAMENEGVDVSVESLSYIVNAWTWQQGNLGDGKCAKMAESNLRRLLEMSPDDEIKLKGYDFVLEAWSKSQDEDAPMHADRILNEMKSIKKKSNSLTSTLPNSQSYTNAILAFTKSNKAARAHELLYECIQNFKRSNSSADLAPELFAFNSVISALAREGRTDKAEEVLWEAEEIRKEHKSLAPDIFTYNSILYGYLKQKDSRNRLEKIQNIFDHMEANKGEQPAICPDCFSYHCILRAWSMSKNENAADKTVETLEKMHELWEQGDGSLRPATAYYNMAINKIAKSGGAVNPQKALDVLNLIGVSSSCDPDIISYTTVIECLAKSTDPLSSERSLELFDEAWRVYQEKEEPKMMPNLRTYTMVILSLSKNPTLENIMKARDLLSQLNDLYNENDKPDFRPNAYPYNYLLNSAASCLGNAGEKLKAFQIAAQTYNDIRISEHLSPDSYTYAFWFKLCNHLLPEGELRRKSIKYSFDQCKKDGMLSRAVLERLLKGTPKDILLDIFDDNIRAPARNLKKLKISDLPPAWSRNVRGDEHNGL